MKRSRLLIGCVALLSIGMVGCGVLQIRSAAVEPEADAPNDSEISSRPVQRTQANPPTLPKFRRTTRPENAAWLLNPVDVAMVDLEAPAAFSLLAGGRPVHFDVQLRSTPKIAYASASDHTLQDALDTLASQADWAYEVKDGTIHVRDLETRTLLLLAQPGSVQASMSVNSLDAGSGGGSNEDDESDGASVDHSSDPYGTELRPLVDALLAEDIDREIPATARLLPNANALLVTARPSTVQKIASVIETYNGRVAQSVRIHLTVYEVTSSSKRSVGSRLAAAIATGEGTVAGGWNVRAIEADSQFSFDVLNPNTRLFGSDLLLEFLNAEGDATINFHDAIEVRNNQIAASSSTRTYQYIASITRQQDALGRERTEVQREQLRTGWAISVHPTIGRDSVTVRLSLARRSLVEERPFQFGESVGTNFVTDDQVRAMTVSLADGESRIITALQASDERSNRNKLAGLVTRKGKTASKTESVLLMRVELI